MYVLTDKTKVVKYPYSLVELRKDNPNTSFPDTLSENNLAEWHVLPVIPQNPPAYDLATENLNEIDPTYGRNQWQQAWSVTKASSEEIAERLEQQALLVRQDRNQRLAACDWTQLSDAPVDAEAWAAYRQELREITHQTGFPWAVVWPIQPEA
jgi:hypothetical protein